MIVLGIDPGTAMMGWGIVKEGGRKKGEKRTPRKPPILHVEHGIIRTKPDDPKGERLTILKGKVGRLLREYKVDAVVAEKIFFNINKRSAISVSQALGIVHLAASEVNLPVYEYNALEVKLSIAGYGRADKKTVQKLMQKKLGMKKHPTPFHAADALAVAYYHLLKNDGN